MNEEEEEGMRRRGRRCLLSYGDKEVEGITSEL